MDAFDADCLIYAALPGSPAGAAVRALFAASSDKAGMGSVVLVPELLSKPVREGRTAEVSSVRRLLDLLELYPVDTQLAYLSAALGARYRLRAADAIHLATAVEHGADRFITNNRRDFRADQITEVDVTYPDDL